MKIALGCDHGGLALKNALIPFLRSMGHSVEDFGTYTEESCDYPDYAAAAAQAVADGDCDRGIVICTTGIGVSIVANKIKGIRCALLSDLNSARMTRLHNDTNMMALGAAVVNQDLAFAIVDAWLSTRFSDEDRHQRRIDKMMSYERGLKKKRKSNNRRRHSSSLFSKLITLLLSILLVVSLIVTPITTYVTSLTDPSRIVDILLSSGIFDKDLAPETPPEPSEVPPEQPSETPSEHPSETPTGAEGEQGSTPDTQDDAPAVIDEDTADVPAVIDETSSPTEQPTEEPTEEPTEQPTEIVTTEPPAGNQSTPTNDSTQALLGALKDMIGSDMMDEDTLHTLLELPADSTIDTEKLANDLLASQAAEELLKAYTSDVLGAASGMGDNPTLTPDTVMSIVTPHVGELADIVTDCLPEGVEIDRAVLENATLQALQLALPTVVASLPDVGQAVSVLAEQIPGLDIVLKALNFIHIGGLRACALLLVMVLIVIMCLFRLPGLRGMFCVGICGVISALLCGAVYLLLTMPTLNTFLQSSLGDLSVLVTEFSNDFAHEYACFAVIYGIIGLVLVLGTTVLRGFFSMIFNAIFRR